MSLVLTPSGQWEREFAFERGFSDDLRTWVSESIEGGPLGAEDVRTIANVVCESAQVARESWSHADRLRVQLIGYVNAVEIRLVPMGDDTLAHQAEWFVYRP